jgi:predicted TIM-barrel fold metal-dependent hydrolase
VTVTDSAPDVFTVDVHGHYGSMDRGLGELVDRFMSGEAGEVAARAERSNIDWTVISPLRGLVPRFSANPVIGNADAEKMVPATPGLLQWVIIDPREPETFEQADRMLQHPWCVGVKIHPEEHGYPITEFGEEIFRFCAERGALVLTHSGEQNSLPMDYVPLLDRYADARLILAHLGNGWDNDPSHQVRAVQASRHRNIWTDTSSARSIWPGLIEWAVAEIGADRILFGSDTPLYLAGMQRFRIVDAEISDEDRALILGRNAEALLGLTGRDPGSGW